MKKRIQSIDMLRGFMIFYVIILHPLIQRVFGQQKAEFGNQMNSIPAWIIMIGAPVILISLWGSLFTFLTGTATAYRTAGQIKKGKDSPRDILFKRLVTSLLIVVCHFIFVVLVMNGTNEHSYDLEFHTYSLITGMLETGEFQPLTILHLLTSSTLESIAFTGLIIATIMVLMSRRQYNPKKIIAVLATLAIIALGVGFIMYEFFPEPYIFGEALAEEGRYIEYYIYNHLFSVRFAIFPVFAFGAMGAIIGILIREKTKFADVAKYTVPVAMGLISIFGIYLANGFDVISGFANETVPLPLQFLNLGLQILSLTILLRVMDYRSPEREEKTTKLGDRIRTIFQRYSDNSLTIFLMEPLLSIIIYRIVFAANGGPISENLFIILGYEGFLVVSWFMILKLWKKAEFKYSFEWWISEIKNKIVDRRKDRKKMSKMSNVIEQLKILISTQHDLVLTQKAETIIATVEI